MTSKKKLLYGILAMLLGNLSFLTGLAIHFAVFVSAEFTRGILFGIGIWMNVIAIVLLVSRSYELRTPSEPGDRERR